MLCYRQHRLFIVSPPSKQVILVTCTVILKPNSYARVRNYLLLKEFTAATNISYPILLFYFLTEKNATGLKLNYLSTLSLMCPFNHYQIFVHPLVKSFIPQPTLSVICHSSIPHSFLHPVYYPPFTHPSYIFSLSFIPSIKSH